MKVAVPSGPGGSGGRVWEGYVTVTGPSGYTVEASPLSPPHRRRRLDLLRDQRATTKRCASFGSGTTWRTNSATARLKLSKHKRTELGPSSICAGKRQITAAGRHS
jgi:hypothetical protein